MRTSFAMLVFLSIGIGCSVLAKKPALPDKLDDADAVADRADFWEMNARTQNIQLQAERDVATAIAPIRARINVRHSKYQIGPGDTVNPETGVIIRQRPAPIPTPVPQPRPGVPRTGFEKPPTPPTVLPSPRPNPLLPPPAPPKK